MFDAVAAWIEHAAAIVVPKAISGAGTSDDTHHLEHFLQYRIEGFGHHQIIARCQDSQMQKEIQRVHVIVERLFEVNAVRADLTFSFGESNGEPFLLPTARFGKVGAKCANEEK